MATIVRPLCGTTWNPSCPSFRPGGILLLRDVTMRGRDFDVWKVWSDLVAQPLVNLRLAARSGRVGETSQQSAPGAARNAVRAA
jgi:hypothetical protein